MLAQRGEGVLGIAAVATSFARERRRATTRRGWFALAKVAHPNERRGKRQSHDR